MATSGSASSVTCVPNWLIVSAPHSDRKSRCRQRPPNRLIAMPPPPRARDPDIAADRTDAEACLRPVSARRRVADVELGADRAADGVDVEPDAEAAAHRDDDIAGDRLHRHLTGPGGAHDRVAGDGADLEIAEHLADDHVA